MTTPAGLHTTLRLASRDVDVTLSVPAGQTVALIGPNGAGKSTILQMIAGLLRPDSGRVQLRERVLLDSRRRLSVPAHKRRIGLMTQSPLLFDSMSVLDNVAYGPRSRGESRPHARAIAKDWLARVDATELADRRPAQLSGGQAQRISLARTLASHPDVVTLDEPTSALDVTVAADTRRLLHEQLAGRTCLLVTHDPLDVVALASQVVILESGRVAEAGPVTDVLHHPRSRFGAQFAGANLLEGRLEGPDTLRCGAMVVRGRPGGGRPLALGQGHAVLLDRGPGHAVLLDRGPGHAVLLDRGLGHAVFPPDRVRIEASDPSVRRGAPAMNAWPVTIHELSGPDGALQVKADNNGIRFTARVNRAVAGSLGLVPGQQVWFVVDRDDVVIHPDGIDPSDEPAVRDGADADAHRTHAMLGTA